jgi:hypothetical protein
MTQRGQFRMSFDRMSNPVIPGVRYTSSNATTQEILGGPARDRRKFVDERPQGPFELLEPPACSNPNLECRQVVVCARGGQMRIP